MARVCADLLGEGKLKEKRRRGDCRRVIRDSRRQAADDAPPVVSFCRGSGENDRPTIEVVPPGSPDSQFFKVKFGE